MSQSEDHPVVLFDGVCVLCNRAVRFIHQRERSGRLRFASLQSDFARTRLEDRGIDPQQAGSPAHDTIIVLDGEEVLMRSDAVLRIAQHLKQPWRVMGAVMWLLPRFLRDVVYRFVARHRYRWFGRTDHCPVPSGDLAARMIDTVPRAERNDHG